MGEILGVSYFSVTDSRMMTITLATMTTTTATLFVSLAVCLLPGNPHLSVSPR
jgi:hypothetical protein